MSRTVAHPGALYSQPRRSRRRRRCNGHLAEPHWINAGDLIVWSALPPDDPDICNDRWLHHALCIDCAPAPSSPVLGGLLDRERAASLEVPR